MTDAKDVFGYIGMVCLTITLIPQLIRVIRTKSAKDLSYIFLSLNVFTCICFFSYGVILHEIPLIISNTAVMLQTFTLMIIKYKLSINQKNENNENNTSTTLLNKNNTSNTQRIVCI